ncbi:hypothetical protein DOY81_009145 [Sarcophaga bullata]|nr:hypothetical protein DOY81_009145 [Sarcophaga bullata]
MCDRRCCMRPGRVTKNGYLNFLREYRKKHCEFSSATEMVQAGAKAWNRLTCEQKRRYKYLKARRSCRPRRRSSCRPRRRSSCRPRRRSSCRSRRRSSCRRRRRSSCRSRRRSSCRRRPRFSCRPKRRSGCRRRRPRCRPKRRRCRPKRRSCRPRCMRAGPVTSNAYLNFLRIYRRKCCGMSPQETVKRGAKVWCALPCRQRMKYERLARRAACGSKRRRRRC